MVSLLFNESHFAACGFKLRGDDPKALKDVILALQTQSKSVITESKGGGGQSEQSPDVLAQFENLSKLKKTKVDSASEEASEAIPFSSRVKFMLDLIYDIKNDKKRNIQEDAALGYLKKSVKQITSKRGE